MPSREITFRIADSEYARLCNWKRAVEEKIRNQEIETGQTWDEQPISEDQMKMLKDGTAKVHWGYCTEPYTYEFSPRHPNASHLPERLQYVYGQQILIRVTNNVTGDTIDLSEAFSKWDEPVRDPFLPILVIRLTVWSLVKAFRLLRFRIFGPSSSPGPIELGGIPAYSDEI